MIINSSNNFYGSGGVNLQLAFAADFAFAAECRIFAPHVRVPAAFAPDFAFETTPRVFNRKIRVAPGFAADFGFDAFVRSRSQKGIEFLADFGFDTFPRVKLSLAVPAPIINEFAADAFGHQIYAARLLGDGVEIPIRSATVERPKGAIGKRVSCRVSKKDLSLLAPGKSYKFQIGTAANFGDALAWTTELENAVLDSRVFSLAWANNQPADELTFGALEPLADRLGRTPAKNLILFDPQKTSVDLSNQTEIKIDGGGAVETQLIGKSGLSLYDVFGQLKSRLGFAFVRTNIPNFELTRVDFDFNSSYSDALGGLIGMFEPLIYADKDNTLWIIDKTAALPDDFAPRELTIDKFSNWSQTIESASIDGFLLSYVDSNSQADIYLDRTVTKNESSGAFGDADYTETTITQIFRDWKNSDDLTLVLRTDLISETHSTYDAQLSLIGRETNHYTYDAQGKRTNADRTVEAQVPDLSADGAAALLTVRRENQAVFYSNDRTQKGRIFQSKSETLVSGLIAIDSDNTYFDKTGAQTPFKQNFEKAHETGNLTDSMTSEFGLLEQITETLTPLGNNQFELRISTYDFLRGKNNNTVAESKTGDASLSATGGRQSEIVILREGLTNNSRTGLPLAAFAVGELPLKLGKPLAKRMLKRKITRKQSGNTVLPGWDASAEIGVFFTAKGRAGETLGVFVCEGCRVQMENLGQPNQKVTTELDASEI